MRAALLAVALLGCGGAREYRRGAPVPVRPPQAQQGPRVGPLQPGQRQRQEVPRSSERRTVPRAGVWASDSGLRHITTGRDAKAPTATPDGLTPAAWLQCWADVQATLSAEPRASTLSDADYECQRWRLLQACGGTYAMRARMGGRAFAERWGKDFNLQALLAHTTKEAERVCGDTSKSPEFRALYAELAKAGAPRWRAE